MDVGVPEEGDVVMSLPEVSRMVSSHQMSDVKIACRAEHEDSPFFCSYTVIILLYSMPRL